MKHINCTIQLATASKTHQITLENVERQDYFSDYVAFTIFDKTELEDIGLTSRTGRCGKPFRVVILFLLAANTCKKGKRTKN